MEVAEAGDWMVFLKDWVALVVSCLALLVSAGTAYFNLLKQTDDIRMISGGIELARDVIDSSEENRHPVTLTFINAGNRPAVIYQVQLAIARREKAGLKNRSCLYPPTGSSVARDFQFAPIIIKPGEIVAREFEKGADIFLLHEGKGSLGFESINATHGEAVFGCLIVSLSTPDIASYTTEVLLVGLTAVGITRIEQMAELGDVTEIGLGKNKLYVLVRRSKVSLF